MKMHEKQLTDKMMYLYMYCSNEDAVWFRFFNLITELVNFYLLPWLTPYIKAFQSHILFFVSFLIGSFSCKL